MSTSLLGSVMKGEHNLFALSALSHLLTHLLTRNGNERTPNKVNLECQDIHRWSYSNKRPQVWHLFSLASRLINLLNLCAAILEHSAANRQICYMKTKTNFMASTFADDLKIIKKMMHDLIWSTSERPALFFVLGHGPMTCYVPLSRYPSFLLCSFALFLMMMIVIFTFYFTENFQLQLSREAQGRRSTREHLL